MNPSRVAALHRALAELDEQRAALQRELADAYVAEEEAPRTKPRAAVQYPDMGPVDDVTRANARRLLRRAGVAPR